MEQRTITILDTAASKKVEVITDATTLGELKRAAVAAGINVENKDWKEGNSKVLLLNDDSLLPTNVRHIRTGQITNNLAFMLTNSNNKIESGADRKALYEKIKKLHLEDEIKEAYGRNYTQVKTSDLEALIEDAELALDEMKTQICEECDYKEKYFLLVNGLQELLNKASQTSDYTDCDLQKMLAEI